MYGMFRNCSKLTGLNMSNWDTSSVTDMSYMFYYSYSMQTNCSNWNVAKVTDYTNFNTNAPGVILPLAWQTSASADTSGSNAVVLNAPEDGQSDAGSNVDADNEDAGDDVDGKLDASGKEDGLQGRADSDDSVAIGDTEQENRSGQEIVIAA